MKSGQLNAVSNGARSGVGVERSERGAAAQRASDDAASDVKFCALDNPECEACQ